ncbi:MAG: DUF354 domain-containing protein [Thermoplasmata archaeon]
MHIWLHIKNSHEPLFFKSILNELQEHTFLITVRDYIEVTKLLKKYEYDKKYGFEIIDRHYGKYLIAKGYGKVKSIFISTVSLPHFDVSISHAASLASTVAYLRNKPSIWFADNDLPSIETRMFIRFVPHIIVPKSIARKKLESLGAKYNIYHYDGFKEQIYLADYLPDPHFLGSLPFKDFVTVRPEALKAVYVERSERTIVPSLLKALVKEGFNVLYLPRYPEDKEYARGLPNVYIPPTPLNGLDVCYYSSAVLSGSGTMAREAAVMGTPAVQFIPGENLSVDKALMKMGKLFYSRNIEDIIAYIKTTKKTKMDFTEAKRVKNEAISILKKILAEIEK